MGHKKPRMVESHTRADGRRVVAVDGLNLIIFKNDTAKIFSDARLLQPGVQVGFSFEYRWSTNGISNFARRLSFRGDYTGETEQFLTESSEKPILPNLRLPIFDISASEFGEFEQTSIGKTAIGQVYANSPPDVRHFDPREIGERLGIFSRGPNVSVAPYFGRVLTQSIYYIEPVALAQ